jgi:hypothetical protein
MNLIYQTNDIAIVSSGICSAFPDAQDHVSIGTRYMLGWNREPFFSKLVPLLSYDESGQTFISMDDCAHMFYPGVVPLKQTFAQEAGDFVCREHREKFHLYLKRTDEVKNNHFCKSLSVVVYTEKAYRADPDFTKHDEMYLELIKNRLSLEAANNLHVVVAVLGSTEETSPYPAGTLVHNMAGGNRSFLPATGADLDSAAIPEVYSDVKMLHKWIKLAKESDEFWSTHARVAD